MPTLLQAIGDIVRAEFRQDGVVRLEETAAGSTCGPVTLNKSGPALVLKLDGLPPPACAQPGCQIRYSVNDRLFPLFRTETSGLTALCDYLVFYPEKSESPRLFVFLCELKSGNPAGAKKQAENGKLLADYIVAMAAHHHRLTSVPKIEARGLVFSPVLEQPKIANPMRDRCSYSTFPGGMVDMKLAYCRAGASYPIEYFCV